MHHEAAFEWCNISPASCRRWGCHRLRRHRRVHNSAGRRYPNGGFGLSMNMNIGSDISVLEKAKKQFLSSKYVTTKEGIATMLARTARTKVPLPPSKTADGGTEYTWLVSRPVEGNLEQFTMAVDKEGKLTSILTPTIKVSPIRYGKQLKLNPPSWPDMPEEDVEKMDPTRFMAMFAQVLKLFTD